MTIRATVRVLENGHVFAPFTVKEGDRNADGALEVLPGDTVHGREYEAWLDLKGAVVDVETGEVLERPGESDG